MAATEKQRLANQRNAQKSTGPKTTEGKMRSRGNALKHGLTGAGVVLKRGDRVKMRVRLAQWREHLRPVDVLEDCLVVRVALASVRLERCVSNELSDLARRKARAHTRWEKKQQDVIAACVDRLDTEPEFASRELQTTTRGCEWLCLQWAALAELLHANGGWNRGEQDILQRLLGQNPAAPYPGDGAVARLRQHLHVLLDETDADTSSPAHVDVLATAEPSAPAATPHSSPAHDEARAALRTLIDAEVARLEAQADRLWKAQDGPERQDAEDRILIDTSTHGIRLQRYEAASELSLHRNLNQLVSLRKVEPNHQTLARFDRQGKSVGRILVGGNWMTRAEYEATLTREPIQGGAPFVVPPDWRSTVAAQILGTEPSDPEAAGGNDEQRADAQGAAAVGEAAGGAVEAECEPDESGREPAESSSPSAGAALGLTEPGREPVVSARAVVNAVGEALRESAERVREVARTTAERPVRGEPAAVVIEANNGVARRANRAEETQAGVASRPDQPAPGRTRSAEAARTQNEADFLASSHEGTGTCGAAQSGSRTASTPALEATRDGDGSPASPPASAPPRREEDFWEANEGIW